MVLGRQTLSLGHIAPFMPNTLNHWSEAPSSWLQQNGPAQHGFQQFSVWQHLTWKPSFACCLLFYMYVMGLLPAGHAWNTSPGRGLGGHPDRMPGSPQLAPLDEVPLLLLASLELSKKRVLRYICVSLSVTLEARSRLIYIHCTSVPTSAQSSLQHRREETWCSFMLVETISTENIDVCAIEHVPH